MDPTHCSKFQVTFLAPMAGRMSLLVYPIITSVRFYRPNQHILMYMAEEKVGKHLRHCMTKCTKYNVRPSLLSREF